MSIFETAESPFEPNPENLSTSLNPHEKTEVSSPLMETQELPSRSPCGSRAPEQVRVLQRQPSLEIFTRPISPAPIQRQLSLGIKPSEETSRPLSRQSSLGINPPGETSRPQSRQSSLGINPPGETSRPLSRQPSQEKVGTPGSKGKDCFKGKTCLTSYEIANGDKRIYDCLSEDFLTKKVLEKRKETYDEMKRLADEAKNSRNAQIIINNIIKIQNLGINNLTQEGKFLLERIIIKASKCNKEENLRKVEETGGLCQDLYELVTRLEVSKSKNCK